MLRPTHATLALVLALGAPLAVPGLSAADSGGAPPNTGGAAPAAPAPAATATAVASAAGSNGVTLVGRSGAIVRKTQRFRGTVAGGAGKSVVVQVLSPAGAWATVATATTAADGSFVARWRAAHIGRYQARALLVGRGGSASAAGTPPVITVTVHHQAKATWYGPGFYGKQTACGVQLTHATLGVAHRSLPCGTQVSVYYKGRTLVVPVIDRGPFANGADWDLTQATAQALGITETAQIGELALRGGRAPTP
jgi:rare lipoprotein A